jgi:hypothetical protein
MIETAVKYAAAAQMAAFAPEAPAANSRSSVDVAAVKDMPAPPVANVIPAAAGTRDDVSLLPDETLTRAAAPG